jgi:hypothetical protein
VEERTGQKRDQQPVVGGNKLTFTRKMTMQDQTMESAFEEPSRAIR